MAVFSINKDGSNMSQSVSLILYKIKQLLADGRNVVITVLAGELTRTLEQNSRLQAVCGDIEKQMRLCPDGQHRSIHEGGSGRQFNKDDWRHILVAAYKGQELVPGIDGRLVVLSGSSKKLSVKECSECLDMIYAWGNEHGVQWSEDAKQEQRAVNCS